MKANPRAIVIATAIVALAVGGIAIDRAREARRSTLSGFFESQPTLVSSRSGGRVARLLAREGDRVEAGQILLELESAPSDFEADAARASADQAERAYDEAKTGPRPEDLQRQEAVVAEAEANLARLQAGARPEERRIVEQRLARAQANYDRTVRGSRPEEVSQARARERQALAALDQAKRGPTPEEKREAIARLEAGRSVERLAQIELERASRLLAEGAISQQEHDIRKTNLETASAKRRELEQAAARAEAGTPAEELEQARQACSAAKAQLDLVLQGARKEDVQAARADLLAAREEVDLVRKGAREEDIRSAESRVRQAQASLLALRNGTRSEQIAQARAAAASARMKAKAREAAAVERSVVAPCSGIVERRFVAVGDLVNAGSPLIRMADPSDLWLRIYVPERQLALVRAGDPAVVAVDGLADAFECQVESIATQGEFTPSNLQTPEERGKQVFAVRLRLKRPNPRVKAGMYATVRSVGGIR